MADTGSASHMTCNREAFDDYVESRVPRENSSGLGKGIATLKVWNGSKWQKFVFKNVKMAAKADFNIISIHKILKRGWWCVFSRGTVTILNSKEKVYMVGKLSKYYKVFVFFVGGDTLDEEPLPIAPPIRVFPSIDFQSILANYHIIKFPSYIICDSGASINTIRNRKYFINYVRYKVPSIIQTPDGMMEIIGEGSVKFLTYNGDKWSIQELLCGHMIDENTDIEVISIPFADKYSECDTYCNSKYLAYVNRKRNLVKITGLFVHGHWMFVGVKIPADMALLPLKQLKKIFLSMNITK